MESEDEVPGGLLTSHLEDTMQGDRSLLLFSVADSDWKGSELVCQIRI